MQATRLTLICHARTVAQKQARFGLDEPLDADWLARCAQLDHRYRNVRQLLCGPELRTRQTAALFGDEPEQDQALADCDLGRWRGLSIDDLLQAEPQALQSWLDDVEAAPMVVNLSPSCVAVSGTGWPVWKPGQDICWPSPTPS